MHVGHLAVTQLIVDVQLGGSVAMHEILLAMHLAQVVHRSDRAAAAFEGLAKSRAKFAVEVSVDDRIQGAVEVTHPEHSCHYQLAAAPARVAQRRNNVPASNENRCT